MHAYVIYELQPQAEEMRQRAAEEAEAGPEKAVHRADVSGTAAAFDGGRHPELREAGADYQAAAGAAGVAA